jgi:spore maturation protein SpmA
LNAIFLWIVLVAFATAGWREIVTGGTMTALSAAIVESADKAVTLAIGLVGVMTLFLGLMKVAEAGGLLTIVARLLRPLMQRLFPDVPPEHPAMGAMILNIAANVLGLGNAATPFGIRAMQALDTLNPVKGTATDAMVLFLAINTSSVTLLPTGVIALRAAAGSADPAGILPTTLFATFCSTAVAIIVAKLCQRSWPITMDSGATTVPSDPAGVAPPVDDLSMDQPASEAALSVETGRGYPEWASMLALAAVAALIPLTIFYGRNVAPWLIPGLIVALLGFGATKGVRVYEAFVDGAREGFQVAVRIIPYLVAVLVAVAMFRASGAMEAFVNPLGIITERFGVPPEALTMAMLRTLSGSGAFGFLASVINDPAIGPDSYTGYLVSTIQGSTETTFYVLAVYFGSVGIRRMRHAIVAGLAADFVGVAASVVICSYLYPVP